MFLQITTPSPGVDCKHLLEQKDIVPMIKDLDFQEASGELFVMNPPIVKFENDDETQFDEQ